MCAESETDQKRKMFLRDVCGRDKNSNAYSNPNYISVQQCVRVCASLSESQLQNGCSLTKHTP